MDSGDSGQWRKRKGVASEDDWWALIQVSSTLVSSNTGWALSSTTGEQRISFQPDHHFQLVQHKHNTSRRISNLPDQPGTTALSTLSLLLQSQISCTDVEKNCSGRSTSLRCTDLEQKLQPGTHCSARALVPTQLFVLIFDTDSQLFLVTFTASSTHFLWNIYAQVSSIWTDQRPYCIKIFASHSNGLRRKKITVLWTFPGVCNEDPW